MTRIFLPGQETATAGPSRSDVIIRRVLALTDEEVDDELRYVAELFDARHRDLPLTWATHFSLIAHRVDAPERLPKERRQLIGAYFTQEYAVEGAALLNPSLVEHPDQQGLPSGSTRFVMSARAVGDGHLSSLEFRTGTIDATDTLVFDPLTGFAVLPLPMPNRYSRSSFRRQLDALAGDHTNSTFVLDRLPESFTREELDRAVGDLRAERLTRGAAVQTIDQLERIASSAYTVEFSPESLLSERVLMPRGPSERAGIEDVRLLRFAHDDGSTGYLGTYTAFDGRDISSQLLRTDDFRTIAVEQLSGPGSSDKGMALFPRRIAGRYVALSRADRESNGITWSADQRHWEKPALVQTPRSPWEIVQLGNCGPPVETEAGWLVLTHGVGPMRQYGIGAILLDLDDPTVVLGVLSSPLLMPAPVERDGYVPNVVYSCGAMLHHRTLVLPYGCSDSRIRIALIDLDALLGALCATTSAAQAP